MSDLKSDVMSAACAARAGRVHVAPTRGRAAHTCVEAFILSDPTRSTVLCPTLRYFFAMSRTHGGKVAEKSSVWTCESAA